MSDRPFLVTTPRGNVGAAVLAALIAADAPVRAGMHRAEDAAASGAHAVHLDFQDPSTFPAAVQGIRGMLLVRPPAIARVGPTLNRLLDAAQGAGCDHVVFLSVAGAERNRLIPHHRVERHLRRGPMSWTILRPGFFAQNLTGPYRQDIIDGEIVLPAGEGRVAFVDTDDLAEAAAQALLAPATHAGRAYHLTGPEAVDFDDVARRLTEALERRVAYRPASVPDTHATCDGGAPASPRSPS